MQNKHLIERQVGFLCDDGTYWVSQSFKGDYLTALELHEDVVNKMTMQFTWEYFIYVWKTLIANAMNEKVFKHFIHIIAENYYCTEYIPCKKRKNIPKSEEFWLATSEGLCLYAQNGKLVNT